MAYGHEVLWEAAFTDSDDCIFFTNEHGGRRAVRVLERRMLASRAVWTVRHGFPPEGLHVLHSCNGGSGENGCVNINHLYLGTQKDNTLDMAIASRHSRAVVSAEDALEIRRRGVIGARNGQGGNTRELADEYGITIRAVRAIIAGESWKHL